MGPIRGRVRQVDIGFNKEGQLLVATSNGDPKCPIRFYSLVASIEEDICYGDSSCGDGEVQNKTLSLDIHAYPGIFIKSASNGQTCDAGISTKGINGALSQGLTSTNDEDLSDAS